MMAINDGKCVAIRSSEEIRFESLSVASLFSILFFFTDSLRRVLNILGRQWILN